MRNRSQTSAAALCLAGVTALATLTSCTIGDPAPVGEDQATEGMLPQPSIGAPAPHSPAPLAPASESAAPNVEREGGFLDTGALEGAVAAVTGAHGGRAAVAVGDASAGDASGFASWSTIKVPIAIAALRQHPEMAGQAAAAIQVSDNDAAAALWDSVRPEDVEAVLAEGGTPVAVQREKVRPEFSPFGQTQWSVPEQARFASNLQCVGGSAPVLDLMGNIAPDQSYGLGTVEGARFKGGWGPAAGNGAYELRQFGLVPDSAGRTIPVAIAVMAGDGSYETAQNMATQLTAAMRPLLDKAQPANCG